MTEIISLHNHRVSRVQHLKKLMNELKTDSAKEILEYQTGKRGVHYTIARIYGRIKMICQGVEDLKHRENHTFTEHQWNTYIKFRHNAFLALEAADTAPQQTLIKLEELIEPFTRTMCS